MNKKIIPAIIAKNQDELSSRINKVKDFVEIIQLDFMDNKFVPNNSIDFDFFLPKTNCRLEAHLMIENPLDWVKKNISKIDMFLVHIESIENPTELIDLVKDKNKKIGLVLNPKTSIDRIKSYLDEINQVLIMTVEPGFYGSPFISEMTEKIRNLRDLVPDLDIEVDGGITDKTISLVNEAGANMFVSGSYIVKSKSVKDAVENLKKIVNA